MGKKDRASEGWGCEPEREGGCYSPFSLIRMADYTTKQLHELKIGEKILSLGSDGRLIPAVVKDIPRSFGRLYTIPYGHADSTGAQKFIQATADHKFKTMRGGICVDKLLPFEDFLYTLQADKKFSWLSIGEIKLSSPKTRAVLNVRTYGTSNILLEGEVVAYNYSHFRQVREWLNRQLG